MLVRCCSKRCLSSHQIATAGGQWWHVNLKRSQGFAEKYLRNKALGTVCYTHTKLVSVVVGRGQNSRLSDIKILSSVLRDTAMTRK